MDTLISGGAIENLNTKPRAHFIPAESSKSEITMDHLMRAAAIAFAIVSGLAFIVKN